MNELLSKPSIRKNILKMTRDELKLYTELLVLTGVYAKYVIERDKK